jgi:hypothetical protein
MSFVWGIAVENLRWKKNILRGSQEFTEIHRQPSR